MNTVFYLAIARLNLATVGTIEFVGVIGVAVAGTRTRRNLVALLITIAGVAALTAHAFATNRLGLALAFLNAAGFALYIVLGHHIANEPRSGEPSTSPRLAGIDRLGLSMIIAAVITSAWGLRPAWPSFVHPAWLAWGVGVGVCSSVIPYVTDQLAMARIGRAAFALMMALLPASAAIIGAVVLHQIPTGPELLGIGLVIIGILLHREVHQDHFRPADREFG